MLFLAFPILVSTSSLGLSVWYAITYCEFFFVPPALLSLRNKTMTIRFQGLRVWTLMRRQSQILKFCKNFSIEIFFQFLHYVCMPFYFFTFSSNIFANAQ